jgi:hypothetical protein
MVRVVRFALLVVLTLFLLSTVVAVATAETGPLEKIVLGFVAVAIIAAAAPVRRLGAAHDSY